MYLTVAAQEPRGPGKVIARPGQDVELLCPFTETADLIVEWRIARFYFADINDLANGLEDGYSANRGNANLIVEDLVINDNRNGTEYWCSLFNITDDFILTNYSESTFLCIASEYTKFHAFIMYCHYDIYIM